MKNFGFYLLMLLIAMQSIFAMADMHQIHQSDSQHIEFKNETPQELNTSKSIIKSDTTNLLDCQHCCHCHSPQFNYLSETIPTIAVSFNNQHTIADINSNPQSLPTSLFRPPRS